MSFKNKTVLVVGASSGIGAITAISFAKEGAKVAVIGRNAKKLKAVSEECAKIAKKPLEIIADISKDNEALIALNKTIKEYESLDILINNAGIVRSGNILSGTIMETYDEIMNINLRGIVNMTTLAAPHLAKSKGNIINVSSVAGTMNNSFLVTPIYGVSKAGLNHFGRLAANELASVGVRVNTVSPGPVLTDILTAAGIESSIDDMRKITALKRVSNSQEIADLILFLASDKAKGITGSEFVSDNGVLLKN